MSIRYVSVAFITMYLQRVRKWRTVFGISQGPPLCPFHGLAMMSTHDVLRP
jgi:hypothetical protein